MIQCVWVVESPVLANLDGRSGRVDLQPAGRSGNQASSVAFAFVEKALGSENDRIAELQIVGHVDPVLALLLEGDQRMELRRLGLLGLDLTRGGKSDAGRHPRNRRRQGRLPNSMPGSLLRPLPAGRDREVVTVAQLAQPSAGEAEFLGERIEGRRTVRRVRVIEGT